jgi:tight adherence protein B
MTGEFLRVLILVMVFVAVLLGVEVLLRNARAARGATNAINRRLALIARGISRDEVMVKLRRPTPTGGFQLPGPIGSLERRLEKSLGGAGFRISTGKIMIGLMLLTILLFVFILALLWSSAAEISPGRMMMIASFSVAAGFGLPTMIIGKIAESRRKKLVNQFPIALDVFVRGLRAGHPVASALELVTTEMIDPIGSEFGIVLDEVTYGAELRDALQNMADRCGVEDMQMFVVSLSIQAETGGNLAEILDNLSKVIRDRAAMMMKVRALSSEGRMTALILTLLPIVSFVGLFLASPSFYLDVADHPAFIPGFSILIIGFAIGVFWIRKLIDLKV